MNTIEQFNEHVMQTYGRIGLVMESGHGQTAVGEDGKEYIDFGPVSAQTALATAMRIG